MFLTIIYSNKKQLLDLFSNIILILVYKSIIINLYKLDVMKCNKLSTKIFEEKKSYFKI